MNIPIYKYPCMRHCMSCEAQMNEEKRTKKLF